MTQRRSIRPALLTLALSAATFAASAVFGSPAQAAATSSAPASVAVSASADSPVFTRMSSDLKISTATTRAVTVRTSSAAPVGTAAATPVPDAPLAGFCTLDGISGATSWVSCSVVVPATVFVFCSSGAIFSGFLEAPGIYSLSATPCFAIGYDLR